MLISLDMPTSLPRGWTPNNILYGRSSHGRSHPDKYFGDRCKGFDSSEGQNFPFPNDLR